MSTAKPASRLEPEVELAEVIAGGDRKRALTLLMERFGIDVYRSALSRTGEEQLAEDVRQQVFLEAHRDLGQLASPASAKAWLLGITRNRSIDAVRKRARWWQVFKNTLPDADDEEPERRSLSAVLTLDTDPTERLDRVRLAKILRRCKARLSPAAREAVDLCYGRELSHEEVAMIVGSHAGAVQKRISRAVLALRTCVTRRTSGGAK